MHVREFGFERLSHRRAWLYLTEALDVVCWSRVPKRTFGTGAERWLSCAFRPTSHRYQKGPRQAVLGRISRGDAITVPARAGLLLKLHAGSFVRCLCPSPPPNPNPNQARQAANPPAPSLPSLHTHHAATLQRLAGTWMEKDGLAPRSLPSQQSSRPKGIHLKLGPDGRPDWSCVLSPWAVIGLLASCSVLRGWGILSRIDSGLDDRELPSLPWDRPLPSLFGTGSFTHQKMMAANQIRRDSQSSIITQARPD